MNIEGRLGLNNQIAQINTLGHAVLVETLKMAVYYLNHSDGTSGWTSEKNFRTQMNEAKSCYLFVQGTGLQMTMNNFGLNYNAEHVKDLFNYLVRKSI